MRGPFLRRQLPMALGPLAFLVVPVLLYQQSAAFSPSAFPFGVDWIGNSTWTLLVCLAASAACLLLAYLCSITLGSSPHYPLGLLFALLLLTAFSFLPIPLFARFAMQFSQMASGVLLLGLGATFVICLTALANPERTGLAGFQRGVVFALTSALIVALAVSFCLTINDSSRSFQLIWILMMAFGSGLLIDATWNAVEFVRNEYLSGHIRWCLISDLPAEASRRVQTGLIHFLISHVQRRFPYILLTSVLLETTDGGPFGSQGLGRLLIQAASCGSWIEIGQCALAYTVVGLIWAGLFGLAKLALERGFWRRSSA